MSAVTTTVVDIQKTAVLESTRQCAAAGQLYRIWNGELYPETIEALEAEGIVVVPNYHSCDPTKQYAFYNIQGLAE